VVVIQENHTTQVLDMQVIEELLSFADDGDPELLVDLIRMFLDDAPTKLASIRQGLGNGDLECMERAAHSLKGSSGNLGARHLQNACEQMQLASRNHQKADLAKLTETIEATFADAREALQAVLSTHTH
jgi:HPt (histidine-containing phosphotransfer) domain-containing protein